MCACWCVHLCVDLLWDGILLDPGMNFSQLLPLLLGEPGLEGLKHPELLPVFCQHLVLVPGQTEYRTEQKAAKKYKTSFQNHNFIPLSEHILP